MSVHAARYLRTLAMSPRSTANRYRFSSFVKGFGRLVMIRLFGLPIPGTGVGPADSSCVCNMDKHTIQNVPIDTCNRYGHHRRLTNSPSLNPCRWMRGTASICRVYQSLPVTDHLSFCINGEITFIISPTITRRMHCNVIISHCKYLFARNRILITLLHTDTDYRH